MTKLEIIESHIRALKNELEDIQAQIEWMEKTREEIIEEMENE